MHKQFVQIPVLSILLLIAATGGLDASNGTRYTVEEYIDRYKYIAVEEMERMQIPASIKLAQAILESNYGNSDLARSSNNHFGIKCHKGWDGPRVYHDDDRKGECFRKYQHVEDSYRDHSFFLTSRERYAGLFDLDIRDYKKWAKGLKKAGYATNPRYADLLIDLIEEHQLHRYDDPAAGILTDPIASGKRNLPDNELRVKKPTADEGDIFYFNRIKTILVREGDSPQSISVEQGIRLKHLCRYNDIGPREELEPGTKFYLQPKRRKGPAKYHRVQEGEDMIDISRINGVKLKMLYKRNLVEEGFEPATGEVIYLRKKRDTPPRKRLIKDRNPTSKSTAETTADRPPDPPANPGIRGSDSNPLKETASSGDKPSPDQPRTNVQKRVQSGAPPSTTEAPPVTTHKYHVVKPKETLYSLARRYDTTVEQIMQWNRLADSNIKIGQQLIIGYE